MHAEIARQQRASDVELKRLDIERFRLEKEYENIEALAEQKRKDREAAEAMRERRKEWMATNRAKGAAKRQEMANEAHGGRCRVCTGENPSQHTAAEIIFHSNGHRLGAVS